MKQSGEKGAAVTMLFDAHLQGVFTDTQQATMQLPNLLVYSILTLKFSAIMQQKLCDIKESYLYNSHHFIARIKKMLEITLTTRIRQCMLNCYDIIEQSACLMQASKFYIALIAGSRRPV